MILLDTNILIDIISEKSLMLQQIERWTSSSIRLLASSISWAEFLTGPVLDSQVKIISNLIESRILQFGEREAVCAAELYSGSGRRRGSRIDSFIAAVAIVNNCELSTLN